MDLGLRNNNNSGNSSERYSRGRGKFFGGKSLKLSSMNVNVNVKQESPIGQNPFFIPSPASISVFGFPDDSIGRQVSTGFVYVRACMYVRDTKLPNFSFAWCHASYRLVNMIAIDL